jgi:rSAM/selenodomain-associated transferase 2
MRVSAIIPTLCDDEALEQLLTKLAALPERPEEILVIDGNASAQTASLCREHGATWLATRASRGAQLAYGAARARGDVLWFLHADAGPSLHAARCLRTAIAGGAAGGYFRFRFSGEATLSKRLLQSCIRWRCRFSIVYGDQGIFVARDAYAASPGFAIQPLFEEVGLVRALRRTRRFVALSEPIVVDARRWERDGYWRRTLANRLLAVLFAAGVSPARLARWHAGFALRRHEPGRALRARQQRAGGDTPS